MAPRVRYDLEEMARHLELLARGYGALNTDSVRAPRYERLRRFASVIRAHLAARQFVADGTA